MILHYCSNSMEMEKFINVYGNMESFIKYSHLILSYSIYLPFLIEIFFFLNFYLFIPWIDFLYYMLYDFIYNDITELKTNLLFLRIQQHLKLYEYRINRTPYTVCAWVARNGLWGIWVIPSSVQGLQSSVPRTASVGAQGTVWYCGSNLALLYVKDVIQSTECALWTRIFYIKKTILRVPNYFHIE